MSGVARDRRAALAWAALTIVVLVCWYAGTYGDAPRYFFHFDDFWVLEEARRIASPAETWRIFQPGFAGFLLYRPLSTVGWFWTLRQVFGTDAAGYHLAQLGAHVVNACLVYAIAGEVLGSRRRGLATALLYAAAPGHAIAVYWLALYTVTGTALWYFATLYAFLVLRGRRRPVVCTLLLLVALGHGEHAATLPAALTATLLLGRERPSDTLRALLPLWLVAGAYVGLKLWYLRFGLFGVPPPSVLNPFQADHYRPSIEPMRMLDLLGFYAESALGWLAPLTRLTSTTALGVAVVLLVVLSTVVAVRSPVGRRVLFGLLLFGIGLGPVLLLGAHRFNHYVGVAGLGSSLALVAALGALPRIGGRAIALVVALTLVHTTLVALPALRDGQRLRFFRSFSDDAAAWLNAVDRVTRAASPPVREVLLPATGGPRLVFGRGAGHRVFFDAPYTVRLVPQGEIPDLVPGPDQVLVTGPAGVPAEPFPGTRPALDWLRRISRPRTLTAPPPLVSGAS